MKRDEVRLIWIKRHPLEAFPMNHTQQNNQKRVIRLQKHSPGLICQLCQTYASTHTLAHIMCFPTFHILPTLPQISTSKQRRKIIKLKAED